MRVSFFIIMPSAALLVPGVISQLATGAANITFAVLKSGKHSLSTTIASIDWMEEGCDTRLW